MMHPSLFRLPSIFTFFGSVVIGVLLAVVTREYRMVSDMLLEQTKVPHSRTYKNWLYSQNISFESVTEDPNKMTVTEAWFLKQKVRLLCFVMPRQKDSSNILRLFGAGRDSAPGYDTATAIMKTWGRRCHKMVFFGRSPRVRPAGVSVLAIKTPLVNSWSGLREAIIQVANNYKDSYDWFLKVDLETYVIVENLRYYLSVYDSKQPHYFGHVFNSWGVQYNAGEAGFVLSSGALKRLHNGLIKGLCEPSSLAGDVTLGECLSEVGVRPSDTRDSRNRGRFLALHLEDHLVSKSTLWKTSFWSNSVYRIKTGPQCCSDLAVTFHAQLNAIYILEYMIYHLKPFGIATALESTEGSLV